MTGVQTCALPICYDPDCRRTFDWTEEGRDNPVKTLIRRLSELREKHFADAEVKIYADGGKLVMERGKYKLTAQKDKFEIE